MDIKLGFTPFPLTIILAEGGNFIAALESSVPWPLGTGIELQFTRPNSEVVIATWVATIVGTRASWNMTAAQVATVLDASARMVTLEYINTVEGTVIIWGRGQVNAP